MKKVLNIVGWVWALLVITLVASIYMKYDGQTIPTEIEELHKVFFETTLFMHNELPILPIILVAWVGYSFYSAKKSGWRALSKEHRVKSDFFSPEKLFSGSGLIGSEYHNGILKTGASKSGLVFKVFFLFRAGHPPLHIDWNSIDSIKIGRGIPKKYAKGTIDRLISRFSPFQYAQIKLNGQPEQVIIFRWREQFKEHIPSVLLERSGI